MNEILKLALSLSASATLIALLLFALKPLYKNRFHKTWQYYIWLVVVARLLIPFAPETNLVGAVLDRSGSRSPAGESAVQALAEQEAPAREETWTGAPAAGETEVREDHPGNGAVVESASGPETQSPVDRAASSTMSDLAGSLWLIWFGVAALLLVRKVTSYHSFARFIKAGREEVDDPDALDLYFETCEDMGVKPLPLYTNKLAVSPMMVGILKPCIILPRTDLTDGDLRLVIRHELCHYKRRDILYKWLVQVACCVHWFNPMVYFMSREISKNCELSCDEAVLKGLDADLKREYGDTLIASVQTGGSYGDTVASVTMSEDGKLLKERLEAILAHATKSRVIGVCSIAAAFLLLCGAAYAGAYAGMQTVNSDLGAVTETMAADDNIEVPEYTVRDNVIQYEAQNGALEYAESETKGSRNFWGGLWDEIWDSAWENAWDNAWNWDDSWDYGDGMRLFSNSYYRDGYLFSIRWQKGDSAERYGGSTAVSHNNLQEGITFEMAFTEDTERYAADDELMELVVAVITDKIKTDNSFHWNESFFLLYEVSGPYDQTPEALLRQAYTDGKMGYFLALLDHVENGDAVMSLIRDAYDDGRSDAVMFLVEALPAGVYTDSLAERAYLENRSDMLLWLLEGCSPAKKKELENKMYGYIADEVEKAVGSVSDTINDEIQRALQEELGALGRRAGSSAASSVEEQLQQALQDKNIVTLSLIIDDLGQSQIRKAMQSAYDSNWIAGFSLAMDEYTGGDAFLEEFANRAFAEYKYDFQSLLMDYVRP